MAPSPISFTIFLLIAIYYYHTMSPDLSTQSSITSEGPFEVHIFINHDPYLASDFLPSLFNSFSFPDSLWKLPPFQPRQEEKEWVSRRERLDRYILPTKLPSSTTISDLSTRISEELKITSKHQAYLTVFPASTVEMNGKWPEWHEKPLPGNTTLTEAHSYDPQKVEGKVELVVLPKPLRW
jgi:hypothetical protein